MLEQVNKSQKYMINKREYKEDLMSKITYKGQNVSFSVSGLQTDRRSSSLNP